MSDPPVLEGGCACGAIRYRLGAIPHDRGFCHCTTCRRASGAPLLAFGSVPRDAFVLLRGEPRRWRSSELGERTFCGTCGAQLTMGMDDQPEVVDVALATLDEPASAPPEFHIWTRSRVPWMRLADDLPQYPQSRPHTDGA